jgi:hypothetical protein
MRRVGIYGTAVLVLLFATESASDARSRPKPTATCPPGHSHLLVADAQAQVFVRPGSTSLSGPFEIEEIY